MNKTASSRLLAALLLGYAVFCLLLVLSLGSKYNPFGTNGDLIEEEGLSTTTPLPDFSAIEQTPERKQQFLDMLRPMIEEKNTQLLKSRARLLKIQEEWNSSKTISGVNLRNFEKLREKYHVTPEVYPSEDKALEILLLRVDQIPEAMVLAQAAVESGWGTSRFAEEAYNLFGQWCYTPGCGIVPNKRAASAKHEVKKFASVEESLLAYFRNINTHNAYRNWRQLRAQLRANPEQFTGLNMVAELGKYSGRGDQYISELRTVIRANRLE
jgi:Bax protein